MPRPVWLRQSWAQTVGGARGALADCVWVCSSSRSSSRGSGGRGPGWSVCGWGACTAVEGPSSPPTGWSPPHTVWLGEFVFIVEVYTGMHLNAWLYYAACINIFYWIAAEKDTPPNKSPGNYINHQLYQPPAWAAPVSSAPSPRNSNPEDWTLYVGIVESTDTLFSPALSVSHIVAHEGFSTHSLHSDIALVKMSRPLNFTGGCPLINSLMMTLWHHMPCILPCLHQLVHNRTNIISYYSV